MKTRLRIYDTKHDLAEGAAELIAATIEGQLQTSSACSLALSGGSTPKEVYRELTTSPHRDRIDWQAVHLFWGDERAVPPDHADSNYGMARETLLRHVPIPVENVHRVAAEKAARVAASDYEAELQNFFPGSKIEFDLVLLGLGSDGHTASLFPGTAAVSQTKRLVTEVYVPKLNAERITFTLPVINAAKRVAFLVSGEEKATIVRDILQLEQPDHRWPASLVQPRSHDLLWLLDRPAAGLLQTAGGRENAK